MSADIRWKQRFQNFDRACALLAEALQNGVDPLSDLEREGVVQRFKYTFELGWKTLRDYLEEGGIDFSDITPREVIKQGVAAKVITDGQPWIDMLEDRNRLAHKYDETAFRKALVEIEGRHLPTLLRFRNYLQERLAP